MRPNIWFHNLEFQCVQKYWSMFLLFSLSGYISGLFPEISPIFYMYINAWYSWAPLPDFGLLDNRIGPLKANIESPKVIMSKVVPPVGHREEKGRNTFCCKNWLSSLSFNPFFKNEGPPFCLILPIHMDQLGFGEPPFWTSLWWTHEDFNSSHLFFRAAERFSFLWVNRIINIHEFAYEQFSP